MYTYYIRMYVYLCMYTYVYRSSPAAVVLEAEAHEVSTSVMSPSNNEDISLSVR